MSSTGRLVIVSNRVGDPRKAAAGGLAVALGDALERSGGLWFGWSGKVVDDGAPGEGEVHHQRSGDVELVTIDLAKADHDTYYAGYSNQALSGTSPSVLTAPAGVGLRGSGKWDW